MGWPSVATPRFAFCLSPPGTNELEDNLQSHSRCSATTADKVVIQESTRRGVRYVSARQPGLLWMIQRVERLDAIFDLNVLSDPKDLEQAQVEVLNRL